MFCVSVSAFASETGVSADLLAAARRVLLEVFGVHDLEGLTQ
ncbi:Uncharacterised protein [Mycobacteroides abscessus subsp. abscessus]|nr:Uncharacterised protein [Mycobacteroides abscessus subsp. abscessus]